MPRKSYIHLLYSVAIMMLFWALFDGLVSFVTPILITEKLGSRTEMGLILGSSSIAGALCDIFLSKVLRNTHFRRMYLFMFMICFLHPLVLMQANTVIVYLIAMILWGLYYDLQNFATFDFMNVEIPKAAYSSSFGVITVFKSAGYLIAPLIAEVLILEQSIDVHVFYVMWDLLIVGLGFYILLWYFAFKHHDRSKVTPAEEARLVMKLNPIKAISLWEKLSINLLPVLVFTMFFNILDAFFWTLGPLTTAYLQHRDPLGSFFMLAYSLPSVLVGWFVGRFTRHLGKKRTSFVSFFLGSILLSLLFFVHTVMSVIILVFLSSLLISLGWPSIKAAYADYISETTEAEKEIEGLEDFFTNIGYVVGPVLAGYLADHVGNINTFAVIGVAGMMVAVLLILKTPRKIHVQI